MSIAARQPARPHVSDRPAVDGVLLTTAEVARHYRVGLANVLAWIHSGALRAMNTSKGLQRPRYRIRRQDLAEF